MIMIEKIAALGGPKHLFGLWKRVFKPKTRVAKAIQGAPAGQTFIIPTKETRARAAAKALKATKRQAVRGAKAVGKALPPEAIPAAAIGAGGVGAGYLLGRRREKKKERK